MRSRRPAIHAVSVLVTLALVGTVRAADAPASRPADDALPTSAARGNLLGIAGPAEMTTEQLRDVKTTLLMKRQLVIVSLEGKKARLTWLQQSTDALMQEVDKAIQKDETIVELTSSLASERQQLGMAQKAGVTAQELALRQLDIARTAAAITERRETIRGRIQGGAMVELTRNRIDCLADIQDLQAQLTSVETQLAAVGKPQVAAK
jgi:hypothetical protein